MIQQTELDAVKALLEVGKQLIPLLTEKKIDNAIAGIAEAKAVIAEKNLVISESEKASKKAKDIEAKLALSAKLKAEIDAGKDSLAVAEAALKTREAALVEAEAKVAGLIARVEKQSATLAAAQLKLDKALSDAQAEHDIATALKNEFNEKLNLVKAL